MIDTDFIRSQFPAFAEPSLQGWAFFENAGGSYTCRQVIDRLQRFYTQSKVQPYGPYPAAQQGGAQMDESYQRLSAYLNVQPEEVNFGPSTTQNTYVLAQAIVANSQAGDEIIVTNQDHEANSGAWRRLADRGMKVREWSVNAQTGMLDIADLEQLLNARTRVVAFPHCSNLVAHVNPVAQICAKARAVGALSVVDGVSFAGHGLPDVQALGADIYLFSMYKTFGPHQGLMVIRESVNDKLANQGHFFNANLPHKTLVPAGPDHAQVAAAAGVAEYLDAVHAHHFPSKESDAAQRGRDLHGLFQQHEQSLLQPLLDFLSSRNDTRVLGPTDATIRAATVAVEVQGDPEKIAALLAKHKIMCWSGHFYAYRLVEAMGLNPETGALRLSFVHYTTHNEIDQLIAALEQTL